MPRPKRPPVRCGCARSEWTGKEEAIAKIAAVRARRVDMFVPPSDFSAMFQSLGWKNKIYGPFLDRAARVIGLLIFLGYSSIPVAIKLFGYGREALK